MLNLLFAIENYAFALVLNKKAISTVKTAVPKDHMDLNLESVHMNADDMACNLCEFSHFLR